MPKVGGAVTLPVLLAYAALAFVALLAVLASRWPAWAKGLLVVGVTLLYFHADRVFNEVLGWPTRAALPERFVLLSAVIDEPNAKHEGGLHLWVQAMADGRVTTEPRAYRLPYTKAMHLTLSEGTQRIRTGISQMGIVEPKPGFSASQWMRAGNDAQVIRLQDLPGPQLPEK